MKQLLAFVAAFVLIGTVAVYGHRALGLPVQQTAIHQVVEIPEGASFKEAANLLAQKGLIRSPFWFRLLGKFQDAERKIKPGEYDLHTAMRPIEILNQLVSGRVPLEASGGVTLETIRAIAETGVDYISVGRITQSAPAVDIGLDYLAIQ